MYVIVLPGLRILKLMCVCDRRPGILVLVNDTDWEILGGTGYELQPNDNIVFISTLHGG